MSVAPVTPKPLVPPPIPEPARARAREADALVARAKAGDARAFTALTLRYRPRIYSLALHLTGSRSDADDVTQDAFLRAFENLPRFEGRSEFFTWLYRIALHRAFNLKRDRRRRRESDFDDPRVACAVEVDSRGNPQRAVELRESYRVLLSAFDALSPLLKQTVALITQQGLSYAEAAVVLDTTEGTIAWRIHEARKIMRRHIDAASEPVLEPVASLVGAQRSAQGRKAPPPPPQAAPRATPARPARAIDERDLELPSLEMALALLAPGV